MAIKKAIHPCLRDERHSFRGTTRIRQNGAALKALTRSQPLTELPGALYFLFKGQLMGESPALHIRRSHHPALSKMQNQYKAAQSSLLSYPQHISIFILIMQVEFIRLTELFPCDMLKIRKER